MRATIARPILIGLSVFGVVLLFLTGTFFAIGGGQLVNVMRGPVLPSGNMTATPMGDLEYLRQVVLKNERGVTRDKLEQFEKTIRTLTIDQPLDGDAASLVASQAMAKLDNAHSTLTNPCLHRLPIRVRWFADGLFIVKARSEWANLLGLKIVSIGERSPDKLLEHVAELVSGNESWRRYRSEYFLVAPASIAFLGGEVRDDGVTLVTIDRDGQETSFSLKPDPDVLPSDAFWEWENQLPGDGSFQTRGWKTLLRADMSLPLYLTETEKLFLLCDLPEHDASYIRMNGSINDEHMSVGQFTEKSLMFVRQSKRRNVIVDFRFNWGGGYDLTKTFTRELAKCVPAHGSIYVITGPNTFSAGLIGTARLKYFGDQKVVIVGTHAGDELQFRAEGFLVTLPATGIKVYVSTARHDFQHPIGWFSDCFILDKFLGVAVESIAPDVVVQNTGLSYASGRDEILETIFARISTSQPMPVP